MDEAQSFSLKSPAKLNLFLGITPKIVDGKHQLTTIFTTIDLADTLTFTYNESSERKITIEVINNPGIEPLSIPSEKNIAYKAVAALEETANKKLQGHLHIQIDKHIPHEAGLAGGSSNAATTLKALAQLWSIDPLSKPVLEAAKNLGADVTFFLYGGCALMGGAGEQLLEVLPKPQLNIVLVRPNGEGVSTAAAYAAFDANPHQASEVIGLTKLLKAKNSSSKDIASRFANNLAQAAESLLPQIAEITRQLETSTGVYKAMLTGSGSTVFAVCESAQTAKQISNKFTKAGYWAKECMS